MRNGHRPRTITTTAGDLELKIPRLRADGISDNLALGVFGCPRWRVGFSDWA